MLTRQQLETALDGGKLFVEMSNGRFWRARRNGRTQTWKRDPGKFRIPIKMGLRNYGELTPRDLFDSRTQIAADAEGAKRVATVQRRSGWPGMSDSSVLKPSTDPKGMT